MVHRDSDTRELIRRASLGDSAARQDLIDRHRSRLVRMVAARMDERLNRRLDPSDVVQEALVEAWKTLSAYLREQPLPFYPWLRRIAWRKMVEAHRFHIGARKRSIAREAKGRTVLPDRSTWNLAARLAAGLPSPSRLLERKEMRERIREALLELPDLYSEVLVLRYLEGLTSAEAAAVLEVPEATVKKRHLRAVQQIRRLLDDEIPGKERP